MNANANGPHNANTGWSGPPAGMYHHPHWQTAPHHLQVHQQAAMYAQRPIPQSVDLRTSAGGAGPLGSMYNPGSMALAASQPGMPPTSSMTSRLQADQASSTALLQYPLQYLPHAAAATASSNQPFSLFTTVSDTTITQGQQPAAYAGSRSETPAAASRSDSKRNTISRTQATPVVSGPPSSSPSMHPSSMGPMAALTHAALLRAAIEAASAGRRDGDEQSTSNAVSAFEGGSASDEGDHTHKGGHGTRGRKLGQRRRIKTERYRSTRAGLGKGDDGSMTSATAPTVPRSTESVSGGAHDGKSVLVVSIACSRCAGAKKKCCAVRPCARCVRRGPAIAEACAAEAVLGERPAHHSAHARRAERSRKSGRHAAKR